MNKWNAHSTSTHPSLVTSRCIVHRQPLRQLLGTNYINPTQVHRLVHSLLFPFAQKGSCKWFVNVVLVPHEAYLHCDLRFVPREISQSIRSNHISVVADCSLCILADQQLIQRIVTFIDGRINDMELINREMFIYKRDVASLLPVGPTIAQTWTASVQVCSSGDGQYVGKSVFFANS